MVSNAECVTLSDDEAYQVSSVSKNNEAGDIETILIEEDPENIQVETNGSIVLTDTQEIATNYKPIQNFSKIYDENKLFAEFLLKCFQLEMSDGMLRIINKSLVKTYEETDRTYRNSNQFSRVLVKALHRLESDPGHKFSHVKDMVETLKLHVTKKRAQLITLETNLKKNGVKKKVSRKLKHVVIDLDDEPRPIPTINLDDDDEMLTEDHSEEKENLSNGIITNNVAELTSSQNHYLLVPDITVAVPNNRTAAGLEKSEENQEEANCSNPETAKRIQIIEDQIKFHKEMIEKCEQAEVTDDSVLSPYLRSDVYKREIVNLYKQLCELVGDEPVKKRMVRLQVLEGHPEEPVRRLEQFINDNIGEDGVPMFPDFCDVVQCVIAANIEEKLGWNKRLVMKEANALFTQCGRALQKQRQRREYREQILTRVKDEPWQDPADNDPELEAKLEQNRRLALKKENDLLERYSMLQDLPSHVLRPGPSLTSNITERNNNDKDNPKTPEIDEDDEDSNFEPPVVTISQTIVSNQNTKQNGQSDKSIGVNELDPSVNKDGVQIKQEPMDIAVMLEQLGDNFTTVVEIEDPCLVIEISSDESDLDYE